MKIIVDGRAKVVDNDGAEGNDDKKLKRNGNMTC